MNKSGALFGALLFTREPVDASIYYEWLLDLSSGERPGAGLDSIGVLQVLQPEANDESSRGWIPVFSVESIPATIERVRSSDVIIRSETISDYAISVAINSAGIWSGLCETTTDQLREREVALNCDYSALDVGVATRTLSTLLDAQSLAIVDDPFDMNILYSENKIITGVLQMTGIELLSVRPYWVTYFEVEDIAKTTIKAMESGSRVVIPPSSSPFNQYAVFQDPWGNIFGLSQIDNEPLEDSIEVLLVDGSRSNLGEQVRIR